MVAPQGKRAAEPKPVQRFCAIKAPVNCQINRKIGFIQTLRFRKIRPNSSNPEACDFVPAGQKNFADVPSWQRQGRLATLTR
jgi:hypothetical protein